MRIGFSLPISGEAATGDGVRAVAERAEAIGFDSVWGADRVLVAVNPQTPYPGGDGKIPDAYRRMLDPFVLLAFAAACTKRVRLGTSVIDLPFYKPVLLARELTTLDILSNGRLSVGFGTGWSQDEFDAVNLDKKEIGARTDEALDLLFKYWSEELPEHKGKFYTLPKSYVVRPVQRPRPPVYFAAFNPKTMKRAAERADGWNPAGIPIPVMKQMWDGILGMAAAAGRDPKALELIVRANVVLTREPIGGDQRPVFNGTAEQIRGDIQATRDVGAHELLFDVSTTGSAHALNEHIEQMELLWQLTR